MHRSGTSAVAEALRAAGLDAGPERSLMDPEPQNPMGFGERLDIALFNDRLLSSLEWFWDAPDTTPRPNPPARPDFVAEGRALVQKDLAGPRPFMLKDPRISLLLPWWRQILFDRFVPVVVLRDPVEVAWSLNVRDGFPIELGLALWAAYHRHLAAGLDGMEWIGVDYAALCDKPRPAMAGLLKSLAKLGVEAPTDSRAGARMVRPLLRRATHPKELAPNPDAIGSITALRAQWPGEAVSINATVESSPAPPSEWEKAILGVHRRTREAKAREDSARTRLAELESQFAKLSTQHGELGRVAATLRSDTTSLRRDLENASRERDAALANLAGLELRFEAVNASRSRLEVRLATLSAEHTEIESGMAALRQAADSAASQRDLARASVAEQETRLAKLGSEHTELGRSATTLRQQLADLSRDRDAAKTSLAKLERDVSQQRADEAVLRHELKYVGNERDAARAALAEQERRLAALGSERIDLERTTADLRGEGALLRQQVEYLGRERDDARAGLADLQTRLAALGIQHVDLERTATELRGEGVFLREQVESLGRERDDALASLAAFSLTAEGLRQNVEDLESETKALRADGAELRGQLDNASRERGELTRERDALRRERAELVQRESASADRLRGANEQLEAHRAWIAELDAQLAAAAAAEAERVRRRGIRGSIRTFMRSLRLRYRRAVIRLPQSIIAMAWHNPLFDSAWYAEQYSDVREKGIRPELHFRRHGVHEARQPNPLFETGWYLEQYPDASQSGMNPLDHYFVFGSAEGRDPGPSFSTEWYAATNPDVAASGINPLLHYLRFGLQEGRAPTPVVSPATPVRFAADPYTPRAAVIAPLVASSVASATVSPASPRSLPGRSAPIVSQEPAIALDGNREPPLVVEGLADDVRVIALYRSDYYAPEPGGGLDLGASEWLTVARARPAFPTHRQPHVPGELGFYDLRLPETRHEQSELARSYGIHAFCYFEAWGQPDLHTLPFREMLASGQPDFPFTLCLTVDASPAAKPVASALTVKRLKEELPQVTRALKALGDKRAVTVGANPVLLVEGMDASNGRRVSEFLRQEALRVGLPGVFLVGAVGAAHGGPAGDLGVDAVITLQPNRKLFQDDAEHSGNGRSPHASVLRYDEYLRRSRLASPPPDRLQTVLCGWDDTPINGHGGLVLTDATPESYGEWLRAEVSAARDVLPRERRFVFVASWNDWARGAHLEPDTANGRAYLESTRQSLAPPVWAVDEQGR